jgi:hypothetical protein
MGFFTTKFNGKCNLLELRQDAKEADTNGLRLTLNDTLCIELFFT